MAVALGALGGAVRMARYTSSTLGSSRDLRLRADDACVVLLRPSESIESSELCRGVWNAEPCEEPCEERTLNAVEEPSGILGPPLAPSHASPRLTCGASSLAIASISPKCSVRSVPGTRPGTKPPATRRVDSDEPKNAPTAGGCMLPEGVRGERRRLCMCIRRKESLRWTGELVCVWRVELSEPARVFVVTVRGTVEPILSG